MDHKTILIRAAFTLLFLLIYTFIRPLIIGVIILQYIHILIKKQAHPSLRAFGHSLAQYTYEIISYMTFNSDDRPFPFSAWPK